MECVDILFQIFTQASLKEIRSFSLVCKSFNNSFNIFFENNDCCRKFMNHKFNFTFTYSDKINWVACMKSLRGRFIPEALLDTSCIELIEDYRKRKNWKLMDDDLTMCASLPVVEHFINIHAVSISGFSYYDYRDVNVFKYNFYRTKDLYHCPQLKYHRALEYMSLVLSDSDDDKFIGDFIYYIRSTNNIFYYDQDIDAYSLRGKHVRSLDRKKWGNIIDPDSKILFKKECSYKILVEILQDNNIPFLINENNLLTLVEHEDTTREMLQNIKKRMTQNRYIQLLKKLAAARNTKQITINVRIPAKLGDKDLIYYLTIASYKLDKKFLFSTPWLVEKIEDENPEFFRERYILQEYFEYPKAKLRGHFIKTLPKSYFDMCIKYVQLTDFFYNPSLQYIDKLIGTSDDKDIMKVIDEILDYRKENFISNKLQERVFDALIIREWYHRSGSLKSMTNFEALMVKAKKK